MIDRYSWLTNTALIKSGFYEGRCSMIETAEKYPEFVIPGSKNRPEYTVYYNHYVPIIDIKRTKPYDGNTEWDEAANILLDNFSRER